MDQEIVHLLDQRIAAAERSLMDQTGGTNVCRLQQDGRVTGGMKYDEGRLVALNTLRRRLREAAGEDIRALVAQDLATWQEALRAQQARERPAIQWVAYNQGGVDALEDVLQALDKV
ncbi:MAG: hypothetical protein RMK84_04910 [Oscillochloridaceae bacterium]|nr:hypothetical protein [Chloroflexaceae bacterium]MDW8389444.1 hypothetical protein [Oscillochloridaceae bacterium]